MVLPNKKNVSDAQKRANRKYDKEKRVMKRVSFNSVTEDYLLEYLENMDEPFSIFCKRKLLEEMMQNKSNTPKQDAKSVK